MVNQIRARAGLTKIVLPAVREMINTRTLNRDIRNYWRSHWATNGARELGPNLSYELPPVGSRYPVDGGCIWTGCRPSQQEIRTLANKWSLDFGIDIAVLLAIIEHEGGVVRNWGIYGASAYDLASPIFGNDTNGLTQVSDANAQIFASRYWGVELTLHEASQLQAYSNDFAVAMAAAQLYELEEEINDPTLEKLFVGYALRPETIDYLESNGWTYTSSPDFAIAPAVGARAHIALPSVVARMDCGSMCAKSLLFQEYVVELWIKGVR